MFIYLFFNSSLSNIHEIELGEVESYKYLGHYVSYNFSSAIDVNFRLNIFYSKSDSVFRNLVEFL